MKIVIGYPGNGPRYAAVSTIFAFVKGVDIVEHESEASLLICSDHERLERFLIRGGFGFQYLLDPSNLDHDLKQRFPATFRAFRAKQVDASDCDLPDQDEMKRFVERLINA